jgi:HEAT repeat protein
MDQQSAIDVLISTMKDVSTQLSVRVGAARGLGNIGSAEVRAELARVMADTTTQTELRAAAAEALGAAAAG